MSLTLQSFKITDEVRVGQGEKLAATCMRLRYQSDRYTRKAEEAELRLEALCSWCSSCDDDDGQCPQHESLYKVSDDLRDLSAVAQRLLSIPRRALSGRGWNHEDSQERTVTVTVHAFK